MIKLARAAPFFPGRSSVGILLSERRRRRLVNVISARRLQHPTMSLSKTEGSRVIKPPSPGHWHARASVMMRLGRNGGCCCRNQQTQCNCTLLQPLRFANQAAASARSSLTDSLLDSSCSVPDALDDTGGSKVHVRRVQAEWSGPPGLGKPARRTKFHDEENWSAGDVVGTG
jgi:hypothetical protein